MAAELIVGRALLRIFQRVVGFRDFLEFFLALRILRHVGMIFLRELAVGLFDLVRARATLDAENSVVILEFHWAYLERSLTEYARRLAAGCSIIACAAGRITAASFP